MPGDDAVFVHLWSADAGALVGVHNLVGEPRSVGGALPPGTTATEVFSDRRYDLVRDDALAFTIAPFGFRWFTLERTGVVEGAPGSRRSPERASR